MGEPLRPFGASGPEPFRPPGPEGVGPPEEILKSQEYSRITPEEQDLLALWEAVEITDPKELKEGENPMAEVEYALRVSLAYKEGLKFGYNGYNLDYPEVQRRIQMQFRAPEQMASRPQAYYLESRIGYELTGRVRNLSLYKDSPTLWEKKVRVQFASMRQGLATKKEDVDSFVKRERRNMEILSANEDILARQLIALETWVESRKIRDFAFRQRMQVVNSDGAVADLLVNNPVAPDREHMESLFQTDENFGRALNNSLWMIVDAGWTVDGYAAKDRSNLRPVTLKTEDEGTRDVFIATDLYARNMANTTEFRAWNKTLLEAAGGDMDAAKTAWELALTWELVNEFGKAIDENGKIVLSDPPVGNDLFVWTAHFRDKRLVEQGKDAEGGRTQEELFITHSGLPLTVDEIGNLMRSYLHESQVRLTKNDLTEKMPEVTARLSGEIEYIIRELEARFANPPHKGENYRRNVEDELAKYRRLKDNLAKVLDPKNKGKTFEVSLFDLWYHGKLSMTDRKFPWRLTDVPAPEAESGEAPPGTYIGWLIRRRKANFVKEDCRSRPSMSQLADPDFFGSDRTNPARIRNWTQITGRVNRGKNPDGSLIQPPDRRPRTVQLLAWLEYHHGGTKQTKIEKETPGKGYRTLAEVGQISLEGNAERGGGYGDVLRHAKNCGWIFEEDEVWIKDKLGIRLT